jgi:hypothetical protein
MTRLTEEERQELRAETTGPIKLAPNMQYFKNVLRLLSDLEAAEAETAKLRGLHETIKAVTHTATEQTKDVQAALAKNDTARAQFNALVVGFAERLAVTEVVIVAARTFLDDRATLPEYDALRTAVEQWEKGAEQ